MWDRGILKSNAKLALKGKYWAALGVCIVATLISGAFSLATLRFTLNSQAMMRDIAANYEAIQAQAGMSNMISIGGLIFAVFVAFPLGVGLCRYFVQNHFGVTRFDTLFSGFRHSYLNQVGAMFVTYLFISLWSILLIIPGIIKALQYSMVPFILADNPDMPGSRAREISRLMTNGEKGAIFVLGLSFIGWYLLGTLLFVVGTLFVQPYYMATFGELYIFLRDRAIQTNQVNPAELGLIAPAPVTTL